MQIMLNKAFTYWHNGYEAKTYGPGKVDVPDEVAKAAKASGHDKKEEATTESKDKGKQA